MAADPTTTGGTSSPASDTSLGSLVTWNENTVQLKELVTKPIPNLIKVTKGQYRNIGVAKAVHSELYIHSIRTTKKVLAEGVKVKDAKRLLQTDQRFSMPTTYQGWFELLSEDGKAIKALQTVQELARLFPQSCLVRDTIKAYVPRDNGELALDRVRTLHAGEMLTLAGEINISMTTATGKQGQGGKKRLLKCFDAKGDSIYLGFEQKGMFSPVAGQANISGVHNIKGLIAKFRFPILVRLVHGIIPTKVERTFTGVFRLTSVFSDETAFVSPLKKDAKMVPISTREPLKVSVATNFSQLEDLEDTKFFHQKCTQMMGSYMNSIHVLVAMPDPSLLAAGKPGADPKPAGNKTRPSKGASSSNPNHQIASSSADNTEAEDFLFEEIDAIYHYVRTGGPVPVLSPRPHTDKSPQTAEANASRAVAKAMANPAVAVAKVASKPTAAVAPVPSPSSSPAKVPEDSKSQGDNLSRGDSGENITWEEPIYEPLEKIREQKKKLQEIEQTIVFESNFGADTEGPGEPDTGPAGVPQQAPAISPSTPVSSLRQVIKQFQKDVPPEPAITKRPKSFAGFYTDENIRPVPDKVAPGLEADAPPVPPRKYSEDVTAGRTPPATQPAGPARHSLPTSSLHPANNLSATPRTTAPSPAVNRPAVLAPAQVVRPTRAPGDKKRQAPLPPGQLRPPVQAASSQSSALHANHLVYRSSAPKVGPVRPTQLLPAPGPAPQGVTRVVPQAVSPTSPTYVAVAKVGEVVQRPAVVASPVYNNAAALETRTLGRPGVTRQSMYL